VPECLPLPALPSFLSSLVLLRQVRKSGVLGQTEGDEVAGEGLAIEESNNTSAESDLRSGEHPQASLGKDKNSGREPSSKDDNKAAEDVDLNEVDGFLNDDVLVETKDIEVYLLVFHLCLPLHEFVIVNFPFKPLNFFCLSLHVRVGSN